MPAGFGLTYQAMTANDTRGELGLRADDLTTFNGMPLLLRGHDGKRSRPESSPSALLVRMN